MHKKGSKFLRGTVNIAEVKRLKDALSSAKLEDCTCSEECKNEIRNYLITYVAWPIEAVLSGLEKRLNDKKTGCKE